MKTILVLLIGLTFLGCGVPLAEPVSKTSALSGVSPFVVYPAADHDANGNGTSCSFRDAQGNVRQTLVVCTLDTTPLVDGRLLLTADNAPTCAHHIALTLHSGVTAADFTAAWQTATDDAGGSPLWITFGQYSVSRPDGTMLVDSGEVVDYLFALPPTIHSIDGNGVQRDAATTLWYDGHSRPSMIAYDVWFDDNGHGPGGKAHFAPQ